MRSHTYASSYYRVAIKVMLRFENIKSVFCLWWNQGLKPKKIKVWLKTKFLNYYVRTRSTRNVIPILWIKFEKDLILSFPTLPRETEREAQSEMVKYKNQKLTDDGVGNKNKFIRWSKAFF